MAIKSYAICDHCGQEITNESSFPITFQGVKYNPHVPETFEVLAGIPAISIGTKFERLDFCSLSCLSQFIIEKKGA